MRWIAVAALLTVSACVHATPINSTDGKDAVLIEGCKSLGGCFREASAQCPNGYALLDQGTQTTSSPVFAQPLAPAYGVAPVIVSGGPSSQVHIVVRCKA